MSYDPTVGRFVEQDPLGFVSGDDNLYRYVHDDPTNRIDPLGTDDGTGASGGTSYLQTTPPSPSTLPGMKQIFQERQDTFRRLAEERRKHEDEQKRYQAWLDEYGKQIDQFNDRKGNQIIIYYRSQNIKEKAAIEKIKEEYKAANDKFMQKYRMIERMHTGTPIMF